MLDRYHIEISPRSGIAAWTVSRSTRAMRAGKAIYGRLLTWFVSPPCPSNAATTPDRCSMGGHRNIQHTVRYTELALDRFKNFWRV
jgi:hypothetical protein